MNIREISDIFKDTADNITAIKSYNFGWASDRVRQGNTEDYQELNEFPRVFFAVPTITGSDQTRKQDTYQVTLFFDDLLGYDNEGDEDPTLQIDKWANLQQYANYFVQRLNKIKQSILPNYLFIPEAPSITFDSFTGIQRMITVQISFNLVVPTNCDPGIITLVQCIANIVTSSNLTASLTTVLKFAASLEGRATVTADINFVQKVASSLNAFGTLTGDITFVKNMQAALNGTAALSGGINFVQKPEASLLTSSSVTGNIIIPKLVQASLTGAGTTAANLTVTSSGTLLLDLYPNAAAAYSLRKLRSAYTGSAIRVRANTSGAEGDVSFDVNNTISASSTVTVTAVGTSGLSIGQQVTFSTFWNAGGSNQNVFVTTWYDQSGNARNATQTTQANQPQIVSSGVIVLVNAKPALKYVDLNDSLNISSNFDTFNNTSIFNVCDPLVYIDTSLNARYYDLYDGTRHIQYLNDGVTNRLFVRNGLWQDTTSPNQFTTQKSPTKQFLSSLLALSSSNNLYVNNIIQSKITDGNVGEAGTISTIGMRSDNNTTTNFIGDYQELVIYQNNQSSNRVAIETNINTHYAIY